MGKEVIIVEGPLTFDAADPAKRRTALLTDQLEQSLEQAQDNLNDRAQRQTPALNETMNQGFDELPNAGDVCCEISRIIQAVGEWPDSFGQAVIIIPVGTHIMGIGGRLVHAGHESRTAWCTNRAGSAGCSTRQQAATPGVALLLFWPCSGSVSGWCPPEGGRGRRTALRPTTRRVVLDTDAARCVG